VAPSLSSHGHPVIDLQSRAKKRELEEKHRWEPTPPERQKIAAAALGHPKRIVNVKSVKHPPPREPTISFESRQAFNKLCELDWRAGLEMMNLSEQDLCGLKRLLEEKLDKKDGSGAIMRGIVQRVDEKRRIRHLRCTGEGEWYAVVQLFKWAENYSGEVVRDWSQRCPTHQEALQLVRQLTAENAHHIGEHMSLESRLVSALEWDTDED